MINLLLGKRVHTPQHLERLFDMVDEAKAIYYKAPKKAQHIVIEE